MIFKARQQVKKVFRRRGDALPNTYIIGAQKAGTTSMQYYLSQHKDVSCSFNKEVHFFDRENHYKLGLDWYKKQFPRRNDRKIILDATPRYLYIKAVPERILKLDVPSKFIVLIRDPLSRSFSAWNMYSQLFKSFSYKGRLKENLRTGHFAKELIDTTKLPDYNTLVERELNFIERTTVDYEPSIIKRGLYKDQIQNWLNYFGKSDFLFLQMENMKSESGLKNTLMSVLNFLEISNDEDYFNNLSKSVKHKRAYKASLDTMITKENKTRLIDFFKTQNAGLDDVIDQEIKWLKD